MAEGLEKLEDLLVNFTALLQAAHIASDDAVESRSVQGRRAPGDIVEVLAEKVVTSGQALLGVIGQLKRNALLSDFITQSRSLEERKEVLAKEVRDCDAELKALKLDMAETVQDLERLCYSCSVQDDELLQPQSPSPEMLELKKLLRNVFSGRQSGRELRLAQLLAGDNGWTLLFAAALHRAIRTLALASSASRALRT